jgi:arsenate reductase
MSVRKAEQFSPELWWHRRSGRRQKLTERGEEQGDHLGPFRELVSCRIERTLLNDDAGMKKLRVLFVCTGNRARSQMAEGFLRQSAGDRFEVHSAGTEPKGLSPITVEVMREVGIDVSAHRSKSVEEFVSEEFDYVVTVCDVARAAFSGFDRSKRELHWSITDPAELEASGVVSIEAFRAARDELRSRIEEFIEERIPGTSTK